MTHYRQFEIANQSTVYVFGLGEKTGEPGRNPKSTRRTWKLRAHRVESGFEPPNPEVQGKHPKH